jgi:hypothetical protein
MTKGYIVLLPQDFSAEDFEDEIKEIVIETYDETDEIEFDEHKKELFNAINNFSDGGVCYANDERDEDLPWKVMGIILDLCAKMEWVITPLNLTDGEDFIVNLREYEDRIEELL